MGARKLKPKAWNWQERSIEDWNTTTVRAYLRAKHEELLGIPYVAKNVKMEAGQIKWMLDNYGPEVTRAFIDECFRDYKPNPRFPGLNFWFMFTYMRNRVLPRVLEQMRKAEERNEGGGKGGTAVPVIEDIRNWL